MSLAAGEFNRRIKVRTRAAGRDPFRQPNAGWAEPPVWEGWANIRGSTGMGTVNQFAAREGITRDLNSYSVRVRYNPRKFDSGMQVEIVADGILLNVKQVRHDFTNREWTDLVCEAGNDG